MPTPIESVVKNILQRGDRDLRCRAAIETAWEHCQTIKDRAWYRRKSTTAALMWEHSIANATTELADDAGVKVIAHQDTTSFIIDDVVLLRFKRAGLNLLTRNYPTPLANMFHSHSKDLFGFDGHQRVELVHVPNRFQTALDWIGVVARDNNHVLWEFELRNGGASVIEFPPVERLSPAADAVLRPTKPASAEQTEAEER